MEENNCIRCNEKYPIPNHPMAHFFVICQDCHKKDPENISDQNLFKIKLYSL